ncbi:MAG: hypothetical protein ABH950_03715 [Candidatus Altiarchaeota archaeon]
MVVRSVSRRILGIPPVPPLREITKTRSDGGETTQDNGRNPPKKPRKGPKEDGKGDNVDTYA